MGVDVGVDVGGRELLHDHYDEAPHRCNLETSRLPVHENENEKGVDTLALERDSGMDLEKRKGGEGGGKGPLKLAGGFIYRVIFNCDICGSPSPHFGWSGP